MENSTYNCTESNELLIFKRSKVLKERYFEGQNMFESNISSKVHTDIVKSRYIISFQKKLYVPTFTGNEVHDQFSDLIYARKQGTIFKFESQYISRENRD